MNLTKKKKKYIYIYIYIKHYQIFEKFLIEELHIQIDNPIEFTKKKGMYKGIYKNNNFSIEEGVLYSEHTK